MNKSENITYIYIYIYIYIYTYSLFSKSSRLLCRLYKLASKETDNTR